MWSRPDVAGSVSRRRILALACSLPIATAGCGFRLRGRAELPEAFERLYITGGDRYGELQIGLRRELAAHGIELVDGDAGYTARLEILNEQSDRRVLSRGGDGRASEYELVYQVAFRAEDAEGHTLVEDQDVRLTRDYTFDPQVALAKSDEEEMIRENMREEAVRQIMRRLEAAGAKAS